jgi:hypothetical protein
MQITGGRLQSLLTGTEIRPVHLAILRTTRCSSALQRRVASFAIAAIGTIVLMWTFYDRFWYIVDEGIYAHVAERLLAGDVLNRDVQSLHPGYINFVNAGAFAIFGVDLISLRYPLVLITVVQAVLVWSLFASRDLFAAAIASLAITTFGVIEFLNPAAHWYSLFLTTSLIWWLQRVPVADRRRIPGAGLLLGAISLFRLLTGIWVAAALLVILLREQSDGARGRSRVIGQMIVLLLMGLLLVYLGFNRDVDPSGMILLAAGPLSVLALAVRQVRASTHIVGRVVVQLVLGALLAAAPLVAYHIVHGSIDAWLRDTLVTSVTVAGQRLYDSTSFAVFPVAGLLQLLSFHSPTATINGLYWVIVPLVPLVNAILTFRAMLRGDDTSALSIVAVFYSLVTLHLAGAVYLFFSVGLSVIAVLWHVSLRDKAPPVWSAHAVIAGLMIVAVVFHAGQSSFRTVMEVAEGYRTVTANTVMCSPFFRSGLRVPEAECAPYRKIVAQIQAESSPSATIFALPSDSELYFLSARKNPFPFYNSAVGLQTAPDVAEVLAALKRNPPRVVTYRPEDKYNTDASRAIMQYVRSTYDHFDTIGGVELYRVRAAPMGAQ